MLVFVSHQAEHRKHTKLDKQASLLARRQNMQKTQSNNQPQRQSPVTWCHYKFFI
jgi:hypothetical protein